MVSSTSQSGKFTHRERKTAIFFLADVSGNNSSYVSPHFGHRLSDVIFWLCSMHSLQYRAPQSQSEMTACNGKNPHTTHLSGFLICCWSSESRSRSSLHPWGLSLSMNTLGSLVDIEADTWVYVDRGHMHEGHTKIITWNFPKSSRLHYTYRDDFARVSTRLKRKSYFIVHSCSIGLWLSDKLWPHFSYFNKLNLYFGMKCVLF